MTRFSTAFSDPEARYRQRYVDLIVNPEVREVFVKRTRLINTMRNFLTAKATSKWKRLFYNRFTVEPLPDLSRHTTTAST